MAWKPDYVDTAEFAEFVRVTDNVDDGVIALAISSAARGIDAACNRQFGNLTGERLYTARPDYDRGRWVIVVDDIQTTDGLTILIDGVELTDYQMDPPNAVADGKAWTRIVVGKDSTVVPTGEELEVAATGQWGWTLIPDDDDSPIPRPIRLANHLQANRFVNRRDSWAGVAGSPDSGSELRLLQRLDPDVRMSLTDYVRPREVF